MTKNYQIWLNDGPRCCNAEHQIELHCDYRGQQAQLDD